MCSTLAVRVESNVGRRCVTDIRQSMVSNADDETQNEGCVREEKRSKLWKADDLRERDHDKDRPIHKVCNKRRGMGGRTKKENDLTRRL